ncbi:uncharacterized protein LOC106644687 isoform X2 [Copidosoma floridanum]|uniref:uncharacterized protein LOC106644687 isoform X2 n=1 Tax=Copidosoma floridanum TaxID=29053 RepID=UPI000C6FBE22|nr:uncharacterized protein LOC106644687 isoform X2 [Copidosoma floridanum]
MAIPITNPSDEEELYRVRQLYLEKLLLDVYKALQNIMVIRSAQYEYLQSRNPRLPRRQSSERESRDQQMLLVDSDLSRLPLPDLVLSAMQQMPPPPPQVTSSAPNSPTRDATFQFPECAMAPVPSPRPKPRRRRLTSEGSLPDKAESRLECSATHGNCCVHHLASSLDEREWATVGANLRTIADDFHAAKTKDAEVEKSRLPFIGSSSATSLADVVSSAHSPTTGSTEGLLSSLIPAPFRETLWTTIALYLGWRLVSRLR